MMEARKESIQAARDISIAESTISDYENRRETAEAAIMSLLEDKRKVDKENMELDVAINTLRNNADEEKRKMFEEEKYQEMQKRHEIQWEEDNIETMLVQLKEEEKKSKEVLDKKIDAQQRMELTQEDAEKMATRKAANRQDIIDKQVLLSKLRKQHLRLKDESATLDGENV